MGVVRVVGVDMRPALLTEWGIYRQEGLVWALWEL